MTTYPGDDPQQPDDPQDRQPAARTTPAGAGRHRADPARGLLGATGGEQAAEQARPGQPDPTTPYPQGGRCSTRPAQQPYGRDPTSRVRTARPTQIPTAQKPYARAPTPARPSAVRRASQPPTRRTRPAGSVRPMPPYAGYVGPRSRTIPRRRWRWCWAWSGWSARSSSVGVPLVVSPFAWARRPQRAQGHPGLPGSARRREPGPDRDDPRHHRHGAADPGRDRP